ncbi:MAG: glycosyltransferase [Dehalococcoidia bacterium]|nr:glycosyltransferase [Dehalococcoidia bacterium]
MGMFVSLITTVLNEEGCAAHLLDSVLAQSRKPDEIVIVDGGSRDRTIEIISSYADRLPIRLVSRPGCNISAGRNAAIAEARGELIAATDAGVRLSPNWLEDLVRPIEDGLCDVVSGFFVSDPRTAFETAMGATVLPSRDEVDPTTFLPSSRSVAFLKESWARVGGYPEWLDFCEDLVFDLGLRDAGCRFGWAPGATAYFRPRSNLRSFYKQYYQYARGDGKADLWRKRHAIRYATYAVAPVLLIAGFFLPWLWLPLLAGVALYLGHPYRRLLKARSGWPLSKLLIAIVAVPAIRLTGDVAKMIGYPVGVAWRLNRKRNDGRLRR